MRGTELAMTWMPCIGILEKRVEETCKTFVKLIMFDSA
jgi:hypothetical protein